MERKHCWESYESAALIAFYFYTLLPPSYASQLVATGTPDRNMGTNTFSLVSMEKMPQCTVQQEVMMATEKYTLNTWVTSP